MKSFLWSATLVFVVLAGFFWIDRANPGATFSAWSFPLALAGIGLAGFWLVYGLNEGFPILPLGLLDQFLFNRASNYVEAAPELFDTVIGADVFIDGKLVEVSCVSVDFEDREVGAAFTHAIETGADFNKRSEFTLRLNQRPLDS